MNRRDFFIRVGGVALAAPVALKLGACSEDDSEPAVDAPPQATCENGTNVTIGTNHGHELTVPQADIDAAEEKTYDIQGTSAHPHTVTITPADFQTLQETGTVTLESTNDAAHTHAVTVTCV